MNKIELKVREAIQRDVGRGIIRIDPKIADKLKISAGNAIKIIGKKETAAIYWPGYPKDKGLGIVRIDGITRRNAGIFL